MVFVRIYRQCEFVDVGVLGYSFSVTIIADEAHQEEFDLREKRERERERERKEREREKKLLSIDGDRYIPSI